MVINALEERCSVKVKAGIFFSSVIAGCSCADDPTPIDESAEYCEIQFTVEKESANTIISLLVS
jgi:hypothetical protein